MSIPKTFFKKVDDGSLRNKNKLTPLVSLIEHHNCYRRMPRYIYAFFQFLISRHFPLLGKRRNSFNTERFLH